MLIYGVYCVSSISVPHSLPPPSLPPLSLSPPVGFAQNNLLQTDFHTKLVEMLKLHSQNPEVVCNVFLVFRQLSTSGTVYMYPFLLAIDSSICTFTFNMSVKSCIKTHTHTFHVHVHTTRRERGSITSCMSVS